MKKNAARAALALALTCAWGAEQRLPKSGWAEPPYMPISRAQPAELRALPSFGRVEWTAAEVPRVAPGPEGGISGMGFAAEEGQIYLAGGFIPGGDGSTDRSRRTARAAERYDTRTSSWTKLPDLPVRREYTRAIAAGSAIYVVGGGCINGEEYRQPGQGTVYRYAAFGDCFRLDRAGEAAGWRPCPSLGVPRTHMAVGRVEQQLIVVGGNQYDASVGGYRGSTIRATTEALDLSQPEAGWQRRAPIPGAGRGWTAGAALGKRFYVFGGLTFSDAGKRTRLRETWSYDPAGDRWQSHAPPPLAVSGWQAGVFAGRYAILVGGVAAASPGPGAADLWNDVAFVYDAERDRWSRLDQPLPPGGVFNDPGVAVIGSTVYVAGAEGPRGSHFRHFLAGRIQPWR